MAAVGRLRSVLYRAEIGSSGWKPDLSRHIHGRQAHADSRHGLDEPYPRHSTGAITTAMASAATPLTCNTIGAATISNRTLLRTPGQSPRPELPTAWAYFPAWTTSTQPSSDSVT